MTYLLTDSFVVAADLGQTWRFFSTATNLPLITPPWLRFTVVMPNAADVTMSRGTRLDYTIRWMGVPVRWRTRISEWDPPRRFADVQERGPYALWHHEHTYEPDGHGGVICGDRVLYRLPFGPLGRLTHAAVVRRQLLTIFRYRRTVIAQHLGGMRPLQPDVDIRRAPGGGAGGGGGATKPASRGPEPAPPD